MGYLRNISISAKVSRSIEGYDEFMDDILSLKESYDMDRCSNVDVCADFGSGQINVDVEVFRSDVGSIWRLESVMNRLRDLAENEGVEDLTITDKLNRSDKGYYTGFR
jgi:hypothetical protein